MISVRSVHRFVATAIILLAAMPLAAQVLVRTMPDGCEKQQHHNCSAVLEMVCCESSGPTIPPPAVFARTISVQAKLDVALMAALDGILPVGPVLCRFSNVTACAGFRLPIPASGNHRIPLLI